MPRWTTLDGCRSRVVRRIALKAHALDNMDDLDGFFSSNSEKEGKAVTNTALRRLGTWCRK